ncbi:MAG: hypothetical protein WCA92_09355, partial [Terriglobales bacterium]
SIDRVANPSQSRHQMWGAQILRTAVRSAKHISQETTTMKCFSLQAHQSSPTAVLAGLLFAAAITSPAQS